MKIIWTQNTGVSSWESQAAYTYHTQAYNNNQKVGGRVQYCKGNFHIWVIRCGHTISRSRNREQATVAITGCLKLKTAHQTYQHDIVECQTSLKMTVYTRNECREVICWHSLIRHDASLNVRKFQKSSPNMQYEGQVCVCWSSDYHQNQAKQEYCVVVRFGTSMEHDSDVHVHRWANESFFNQVVKR